MNVPTTIDAAAWLGKYLEGADGDTDLARAMLGAFAEALMSAQASHAVRCRLWRAQRGAGELAQRLSAPALGHPGRHDRAGRAQAAPGDVLARVLARCPAGGPNRRWWPWSARPTSKGSRPGGSTTWSRPWGSTGSPSPRCRAWPKSSTPWCAEFKERPLDGGPYRYLWIDALTQRVREGGRVVNVSAVIATAVNVEGHREIVGFDIATTEDTAGWTAFLRALVARGLRGVELVISDAHGGIKAAIALVFAEASWQRCRTHFMANLASRCAKGNWPMIATLVRSIFEQPDRDTTWAQLADVTDKLTQAGFCDVGDLPARRRRRHLGLQRLPGRALAEDPLQQPPGTAEQGDPPAHRRRRDLPQPRRRHPPGRRLARRADRRVGHHQALHERRVTQDPRRLDAFSPSDPRPAIDAAWGLPLDSPTATDLPKRSRHSSSPGPVGGLYAHAHPPDTIQIESFTTVLYPDIVHKTS